MGPKYDYIPDEFVKKLKSNRSCRLSSKSPKRGGQNEEEK